MADASGGGGGRAVLHGGWEAWLRCWGSASPRLICFSLRFGTSNTFCAPTRGLERSDGGLLAPRRSTLETCLTFLNPVSVEEVVATTGRGEQKTCRH